MFKLTSCFLICSVVFQLFYSGNASASCSEDPQGHQVTGNQCLAINKDAFCGCLEKYDEGIIDTIKIDGLISCDDCAFTIPNTTSSLKVIGASINSGFIRNSGFTNHLFTIENSTQGLSFENLKFTEKANILMDDPGISNPVCSVDCNGCLFKIKNSSNVKFINSEFREAKRFAVRLESANKILFRGNIFTNSWIHAIWMSESRLSSDIKIENNSFSHSRSNAIMFSASGNVSNVVSGNNFSYNHKAAAYSSCGPDGETYCPGGQLLINKNTNNIIVENNIFNKSEMRDLTIGPQGIEINRNNVHNVTIFNNFITEQFLAIRIHVPTENSGIKAWGNTIVNNRAPNPIEDESILDPNYNDNCTSNCSTYKRPSGSITATSCQIPPSSNHCTTTLNFSATNSTVPIKVYLDSGSLVAAGSKSSGSTTVNWITRKPVKFNLYSGNTFLQSVEVVGVD